MNIGTRLLALASLASLPLFGLACVADSDSSEQGQEDDAISASARAYVTLRRDVRKCASPKCGGWFVKDVNKKNPTERYVSSLDFGNANLDDASIAEVQDAPDGEVVVRAKLGPLDASGTRSLLVWEAYRGMPGFVPASGDAFYAVSARDPQIQCFTAPCDNLSAKKLNSTSTTNFTRTEIELDHRIQTSWLEKRVNEDDAIVVGSIKKGDHFAGGYEHVLEANQVLLKLPEMEGPCPQFKLAACPDGQTRTYTRSPDRCILPDACVDTHACPLLVPNCGDGYTLVSYPTSPSGCPSFTCDPTWISPDQQ